MAVRRGHGYNAERREGDGKEQGIEKLRKWREEIEEIARREC